MTGRRWGERENKAVSLGVVALAYATALGAAWVVPALFGLGVADHPVAALAAAYVSSALVIFVWSTAVDNGSMFDAWWSVLPPFAVLALAAGHAAGVPSLRIELVVLVVWVWAVRLTTNWARDWPGLHHEDWRYLNLYTKGPKVLMSLFAVHVFPCLIVLLGSLSMVPAVVVGTRAVGALDALALVVGLGAAAIELVADEQMRRFARTKQPGEVMQHGLWRWSRHPNYFGEILFWWALWIFGVAADPAWWWTVVGPVAITAMFVGASIPMLDQRSRDRRPAFAVYADRTPALVPRPPRRKSTV